MLTARLLRLLRPLAAVAAGVLLAATVALVPLVLGGQVLEAASLTLAAPVLGTIKLTSVLAFDVGVYLAVVGLALMVFESFGDDPTPTAVGAPDRAGAAPELGEDPS